MEYCEINLGFTLVKRGLATCQLVLAYLNEGNVILEVVSYLEKDFVQPVQH